MGVSMTSSRFGDAVGPAFRTMNLATFLPVYLKPLGDEDAPVKDRDRRPGRAGARAGRPTWRPSGHGRR